MPEFPFRRAFCLGRRSAAGIAAAAVAALALTACGSDTGSKADSSAPSSGSFEPVTIEHAFGKTEIQEKPTRVVTIGWGSTDAMLALGVVPVGIEKQEYGGDANGVLPWVADKLTELDAQTPTLLPSANSADPAYEQILKLRPDLILAPYSGITEEQYGKLSKIADTVAYPKQPWSTTMEEIVTVTGRSLGLADEAERVLADIDATVAKAKAEHPEFDGLTIATLAYGSNELYTYTQADPREQVLRDLGFETAPSVLDLTKTADPGAFYVPFSFEQADRLTSDVLLTYSASEDELEALEQNPGYRSMPQIEAGTVAKVVGEAEVAAVSPPTALSVTWGLPELVDALAEAATSAS
ncbi:ABC-type Fe3+-hydroxamate transport system, periplasmic component [Saccharomonospora marina XMU15]|uniref:ABC-type Fe3+-hydroxamate transport system, periplasmic component n=1 Tax=Saccharomonospora marina XMU15 TaxID=882083 RepID=H5X850_9PSEU|nr:iron-siderophore ABC transporter substrate-binding protein [Saccharomonospora marina]EHR53582.1 ABC-type Fe3+-hydroxamate transport system, periplasmic component [Saccharomonospora marina XMU15]